jgi:protein tyrosine phosphatase (PTP) superfamily phosphohydrolase (DUF442 family)
MNPDRLDAAGWANISAADIETVVDLRNDDEVLQETSCPESIVVFRRPVEDQGDAEFMAEWGERLGSPAYYSEVLRRWPDFIAAAIVAIADASGPVLFHCGAGRDRTGMISAMIGELIGVERGAILDDYEGAVRAFDDWLVEHPSNEHSLPAGELDERLLRSRAELAAFLNGFDVERYLLESGVSSDSITRLRARLLDP